MNPEEVVEDDGMDWEWEKGNEPSVDEQMRNLREKRAKKGRIQGEKSVKK